MSLIKCEACEKEISENAWACPSCGHPVRKSGAIKNKRSGCLAFVFLVLAIVIWNIFSENFLADRNKLFDINRPETITSIIDNSTAKPRATFVNQDLSMSFSIDPWLLTTSTGKNLFFSKAKEFFSKAFGSPSVRSACVEGTATFHDIRGNESQDRAILMCMSRESSEKVIWKNVESDNLPLIVDRSWIHPSFYK